MVIRVAGGLLFMGTEIIILIIGAIILVIREKDLK